MMESGEGEQQQQIRALEAHLKRYAERKSGTVLHASNDKQAKLQTLVKPILCNIPAIRRQSEMLPVCQSI